MDPKFTSPISNGTRKQREKQRAGRADAEAAEAAKAADAVDMLREKLAMDNIPL